MESLNPKHFYLVYDANSSSHDIVHHSDEIRTPVALIVENKEWIIKKFYKYLRRHRGWVRVAIVAALVIGFFSISSISYKIGFHKGIEEWEKLRSNLFSLKQAVGQYKEENQQLRLSLTALSQQQTIKSIEYDKLSNQLKALSLENADLKEDKTLYQSVLGKANTNQILAFKKFHLYPKESPNHYRYQLIISSLKQQRKWIQGEVLMAISGKLDDKAITIPVRYLPQPISPQNMRIKFKQFQELSGELLLPPSFTPKMVTFIVNISGQPETSIQQNYPWFIEA